MTTQSIQEYLRNREKHLTTPYIINENGGFYECKGLLIPEKEFISLFPLGDQIRSLHSGMHKGESIGSARI